MNTKDFPNPFLASCPNFLDGLGQVPEIFETFRMIDPNKLITEKRTKENTVFKYPVTESSRFVTLMQHCFVDLKQALYAGLNCYSATVPFNSSLDRPDEFAIGLELEVEAHSAAQVRALNEHHSRVGHRALNPCLYDCFRSDSNAERIFTDMVNSVKCLTDPEKYSMDDPLFSNWLYCRSDGSLDHGRGVEVTTIPLGEKYCLTRISTMA